MTLYIAHFETAGATVPELDIEGEVRRLSPMACLVRSDASQSKVYHAIKRRLPPDTALIVGTLAQAPKFKGMAAGATKWVRNLRLT